MPNESARIELVAPIQINAAAGSDDLPTFEMAAYTGALMPPNTLRGSYDPVIVDLAGMRVTSKSRPILFNHDPAAIVGHTTSVDIGAGGVAVKGAISGTGFRAREVRENGKNGFPWQASIGASVARSEYLEPGETATVNGREISGPAIIARESKLDEVSFVALGADDETSARITGQLHTKQATHAGANTMPDQTPAPATNDSRNINPTPSNDGEITAAGEPGKATPPAPNLAASRTAATPVGADQGAADAIIGDLRASAAKERERIAAINAVEGISDTIAAQAIRDGWDAERAELETLRASRPQATPAGTIGTTNEPNGRALEAALMISAGFDDNALVAEYGEQTIEAARKHYRGAGIGTVLHEVIRAAGDYARPGRTDNGVVRAAFQAHRTLQAAGFSTLSLPGILGNVANKSLLGAFRAVPSVVAKFCAETDHADFKTHTKYRLTAGGDFEQVGASGELKHGTHSEESFTNAVNTYGRILSLTRQDMINDDLGALVAGPRLLGRKAGIAREKAVFTLLLANTGSFFAAGNNNLQTGSGSALDIAGLTQAEGDMLAQTDAAGDPVMVTPAVLLTGTAQSVTAQQLMTETRVNETTTANKPKPASNPHAGKWEPVISPFINAQGLTNSSATRWYLFANPADVPAMEIAYLQGNRTPTIESGETNFDVLGMQWRSYWDFGVAFVDPNAAHSNDGA